METIQGKLSEKEFEELKKDTLPKRFGSRGTIWVVVLLILCAVGLYNYFFRQLNEGLVVTGMRDYVSWGIYISNFVFFVAISLVGSLISAILKLTNVHWQTPLTRIAEVIAVAAIMFASIIIIVDMGRPERFWHLFVYGRIQSPIVWDVIVIMTYLVVSVLLLYIPLIPDVALCRDNTNEKHKWRKKFYSWLSLGWTGTHEQYAIIHKSVRILSVLVIPLAFSIHTVTSWLFATTLRSGWDSTNFGAYFVSGAFMLGAAAVICAMYIFRKYYHLEKYITHKHFDRMGKLLVLLSLLYLYFNVNEYLVPGFKMKNFEADHIMELFVGSFAPLFWSVQIGGMIIPIIVLLFPAGRKPLAIFIVSAMVIAGAWFKRFLIVIPTLLHPYLPMQEVPESYKHYFPTFAEWSITIASLAGVLLLITWFARIFPIIPIWEMANERNNKPNTVVVEESITINATIS
jgi:molybdopterin-containing oxidoreductase family membrane subunit